MQVSLRLNNAAALRQLRDVNSQLRARVAAAAKRAMTTSATELKSEVRAQVASRVKIVKKGFTKGFTARVITKDATRLPALYIGSGIPWAGIHETGGSIGGRLLIPLHGRVGRKRFRAQIQALLKDGNAYFVKGHNGTVILMAENLREHAKPLAGFKRRYRQAAGIKRLKRGAEIPIAVLVPKVTVKKRLDIVSLVHGRVTHLVSTLQQQIGQLTQ